MSYLGSWKIDDYLTFYVNTHKFDTGNVYDADAAPTYRIYEDETGTPILTGTMALLDDVNTVGFYSEQVQLLAAGGFEKGKSYCIRVLGVVNSVSGVELLTFQIEAEVDINTNSAGLALESTLTAMKGAGWTDETLVAILDAVGGGGANTVTITVYAHGSTTPIPEYQIDIWNSAGTVFITSIKTGVLGTVQANLDSGTYLLRGRKVGYDADNESETFIVSAILLTKTIYATAVTPSSDWTTGEW